MKSSVAWWLVLAVVVVAVSPAWAQQPKPTGPATEQQPKGKPTPAGQLTDPDFARGTVDTVASGNPMVITLRGVQLSNRVRVLKHDRKLILEIPTAALQGGPAPRVGQVVTLTGVVRDGKFIIRRVIFQGSK